MKKIISLILCLLLTAGIFSACSAEKEAETVQELKITTDFVYKDIDPSVLRAYEKLCKAVINGEKEVKFNISMMNDVNRLFYTGFPLYDLVKSINFLKDNTGVVITYKNSDEEHKNAVSAFTDKVYEIMEKCGFGSVGMNEYIFNVYSYVTQNVTVDNSSITSYSTIMNGKGVLASINSMFEYLLLQGGADVCRISNIGSGKSKILSSVLFSGQWYYFDPVSEIEDNAGKALKYFAMDNKRAGIDHSEKGLLRLDGSKAESLKDNSFDALKSSVSYSIENSKVTVKIENNKDFIIDL